MLNVLFVSYIRLISLKKAYFVVLENKKLKILVIVLKIKTRIMCINVLTFVSISHFACNNSTLHWFRVAVAHT